MAGYIEIIVELNRDFWLKTPLDKGFCLLINCLYSSAGTF